MADNWIQLLLSTRCYSVSSTCTGRRWTCTTNECDGTCSVYGAGHYVTFDHKRFNFDGNCEYILIQVKCCINGTCYYVFFHLFHSKHRYVPVFFVRTTVAVVRVMEPSESSLRMSHVEPQEQLAPRPSQSLLG